MALTRINNNSLSAVTAASNLVLASSQMPQGSTLQVVQASSQERQNMGSVNRSATELPGLSTSLTRTTSNSDILIHLTVAIGAPANHWRIGMKYSYDNSTYLPIHHSATRSGAGLTWASDETYLYPLASFLLNDSGDSNTLQTTSVTHLFSPTDGESTVYFKVYVWGENSTGSVFFNGYLQSNATHGSVPGSSLVLTEIAG